MPKSGSYFGHDPYFLAKDRIERIKIDASGALPTGEKIDGVAGLKKILLTSRKDDFLRCVTGKLMTYALGRSVDENDYCAVKAILASINQGNYRVADLVRAIVRHDAFQKRWR